MSGHSMWAACARAGVSVMLVAVLCGCGRSAHETERVVDPSKVQAAVLRSGYRITLRPGPTPKGFVKALYGTARNARGISVNFGIFLTDNLDDDAGSPSSAEFAKLVPGATSEGTIGGESYEVVSSAGAGNPPEPRREEEFAIIGELHYDVAGLARKALEEEGP